MNPANNYYMILYSCDLPRRMSNGQIGPKYLSITLTVTLYSSAILFSVFFCLIL